MSEFRYISKNEFREIMEDLNIDATESGGFQSKRQTSLLNRANGELESDLVERFVVPLVADKGSGYDAAPEYAREKVKSAMVAKIRQIIGSDKQKNIVIDSTERFVDLKLRDYNNHIKDLLNHKRTFGFKLQDFASDNSVEPVQVVGVARGDHKRQTFVSDEEEFL